MTNRLQTYYTLRIDYDYEKRMETTRKRIVPIRHLKQNNFLAHEGKTYNHGKRQNDKRDRNDLDHTFRLFFLLFGVCYFFLILTHMFLALKFNANKAKNNYSNQRKKKRINFVLRMKIPSNRL